MNVAVVDSGGNLVAFQRMDGAQLASIKIAEYRARTRATFRRETKFFEKAINLKNLSYLLTLDGVIAPRGGIPLTKQGKIIGTIGCSGGMDSPDEVVAFNASTYGSTTSFPAANAASINSLGRICSSSPIAEASNISRDLVDGNPSPG